jgi:Uma2 family endonuclease
MAALPKPDWRITAEEFAALRRDDLRMELIEGEVVTMPAAFTDHGYTASQLHIIVGQFIRQHRLGKTFTAETGFLIARNPDTVRAPDFAFIQASRVTPAAVTSSWGQVIPDLVAEVVSSSDRANEIDQKVRMWLGAGVRLVWVAWPQARIIQVYEPPAPVQELDDMATLTGGAVLSGFATPVTEIFD